MAIKVHVITEQNRQQYAAELLQHFSIRHQIYVGERKWMKLARPDCLERDQFDNEHAIYLLAIDNATVVGGSRLIPTLKPHLLSEVFPELTLKGVPCNSETYEWTRVHVIKARREGRNRGFALGSVFCGILEYCIAKGVSSLTAIVEMWWLPHFHEMGWSIEPLGIPELIEGEWSIAVRLSVDRAALATTRAMYAIDASVLADLQNEQQQLRISA